MKVYRVVMCSTPDNQVYKTLDLAIRALGAEFAANPRAFLVLRGDELQLNSDDTWIETLEVVG